MPTRDSRTRRYPCPWCDEPDMWPDRCAEPDTPIPARSRSARKSRSGARSRTAVAGTTGATGAGGTAADPETTAASLRCTAIIEGRCGLGDHRRCAPSRCAAAARWHQPVREAGIAAATAAGTTWAVVSTIYNNVHVLGTETNLGRAKNILRAGALMHAGIPISPRAIGLVYIVRVTDGGFF